MLVAACLEELGVVHGCDSFVDRKGGKDVPFGGAQKQSEPRKAIVLDLPMGGDRLEPQGRHARMTCRMDGRRSSSSARVSVASKPQKRCASAPVEVTVIDRENNHCFQPLLYQVATAALSPADVAWPIRHILRKQKNATVLMAEVRAIDTIYAARANRVSESIPYDYLVLATGAAHSYSATTNGPKWCLASSALKTPPASDGASSSPSSARSSPPTRPSASASSRSRSSAAALQELRWPAPFLRWRARA